MRKHNFLLAKAIKYSNHISKNDLKKIHAKNQKQIRGRGFSELLPDRRQNGKSDVETQLQRCIIPQSI